MTVVYTLRFENGKPLGCDSCDCCVPVAEFSNPNYERKFKGEDKRFLCELCASTYIGNITAYSPKDPQGYLRREAAILIAQAANHILKKMTERETPAPKRRRR